MAKIDIKSVKKAGLKALKNNTMQICSEDACYGSDCANSKTIDGVEYTCVIGSALSKYTRKKHPNRTVFDFSSRVVNQEDLQTLQTIQQSHDDLVGDIYEGLITPKQAMTKMKRLLEKL